MGRRLRDYAPAALVLAAGIALWEAVVFAFSIEFYLLPAPHVIAQSLGETYPTLVEAARYTFAEALIGYAVGCGGGIAAAMLASRSPAFADLVLPYAVASASVPIIALAPLAIVWFGVAQGSKIAIVALMTFFPTFISALRGLLGVAPAALELMQSCAATEWQIFVKLRLPHSLPLVFTALRACTTLAMIGAVVSEFFGGPMKSLGVYIKSTASLFQTRQAWSAILVTCALGLLFYFAVALAERLVMPWRVERGHI
ncbi:MAG TPA: ABC transporter permease [Candidatus Methylomirabilis sp.]|nr:ABC transporter permease [Candidatus Methylomirabilis sp.]